MDFCEKNGIDFVFGLAGNAALDPAVDIVVDDIRTPARSRRRRSYAAMPNSPRSASTSALRRH
jgi:hypothetical protein